MELLDAYDTALAEFDTRVQLIAPGQEDDPTPCAEWSVRDLVGHLTSEHLWVPWLLRGATLAEVGDRYDGDVLGDDPVRAWSEAAAGSREAFHTPGALAGRVHVTGGRIAATDYAWQIVTDLTVHAWDLARGIGADDRIDAALAARVLDEVAPQVDRWRDLGIFAAPVAVPADAPAQDRLVGLLGRRP